MQAKINHILEKIKKQKPLVLNVTNHVTMDFIANGLLSLGASPVMSLAKQELEDLVHLAQVVVVNIGTLNEEFISLCEHACRIANQLSKPIIFDPVGVGASHYRTETARTLISKYRVAIIRGNASEIMALAGALIKTKGVDSSMQTMHAVEHAKALSIQSGATIMMSGAVDVVVTDDAVLQYHYGSPMMPMITGTGCLMSAVVGAFHAVEYDRMQACSAAAIFYGICGELAAQDAKGPGSFRVRFLDALSLIPSDGQYAR